MTIDHTGRFFFPEATWMIAIGRLAFPIFAWGIANGYQHTRNIKKYAVRLFIFAIISQIPYSLGFSELGRSPYELNILFTLLLGLTAIVAQEHIKNPISRTLVLIFLLFAGELLHMSYGWYGVALVLIFHVTYKKPSSQFVLFSIATLGYIFLNTLSAVIFTGEAFAYRGIIQIFSICALPPIALYNEKQGKSIKYFFYLYYTLHLALFTLIHHYLQ